MVPRRQSHITQKSFTCVYPSCNLCLDTFLELESAIQTRKFKVKLSLKKKKKS